MSCKVLSSVSLEIDQNQNQSLKALSQLFGVWFMDQIMIHQGLSLLETGTQPQVIPLWIDA